MAIARENPAHQVVFFVAGFETTTAPVAAMMREGLPDNLSLLMAARRTWPAVALLLRSDRPGFEGLIAPGHVATIMGAEEWGFVVEEHGIPTAVAGFTAASILAGLYSVLRQIVEARPELENCYGSFVSARREPHRPGLPRRTVRRRRWRLARDRDDRRVGLRVEAAMGGPRRAPAFPRQPGRRQAPVGEMPPGCGCADVVMGRSSPVECRLYGRACTPRTPVGPCMVSDEGACRIWWANGRGGPAVSAGV